LDGTPNKGIWGDAILAVSMAAARASADEKNEFLFEYLSDGNAVKMPVPMFNV